MSSDKAQELIGYHKEMIDTLEEKKNNVIEFYDDRINTHKDAITEIEARRNKGE